MFAKIITCMFALSIVDYATATDELYILAHTSKQFRISFVEDHNGYIIQVPPCGLKHIQGDLVRQLIVPYFMYDKSEGVYINNQPYLSEMWADDHTKWVVYANLLRSFLNQYDDVAQTRTISDMITKAMACYTSRTKRRISVEEYNRIVAHNQMFGSANTLREFNEYCGKKSSVTTQHTPVRTNVSKTCQSNSGSVHVNPNAFDIQYWFHNKTLTIRGNKLAETQCRKVDDILKMMQHRKYHNDLYEYTYTLNNDLDIIKLEDHQRLVNIAESLKVFNREVSDLEKNKDNRKALKKLRRYYLDLNVVSSDDIAHQNHYFRNPLLDTASTSSTGSGSPTSADVLDNDIARLRVEARQGNEEAEYSLKLAMAQRASELEQQQQMAESWNSSAPSQASAATKTPVVAAKPGRPPCPPPRKSTNNVAKRMHQATKPGRPACPPPRKVGQSAIPSIPAQGPPENPVQKARKAAKAAAEKKQVPANVDPNVFGGVDVKAQREALAKKFGGTVKHRMESWNGTDGTRAHQYKPRV